MNQVTGPSMMRALVLSSGRHCSLTEIRAGARVLVDFLLCRCVLEKYPLNNDSD